MVSSQDCDVQSESLPQVVAEMSSTEWGIQTKAAHLPDLQSEAFEQVLEAESTECATQFVPTQDVEVQSESNIHTLEATSTA